MQSGEFVEPYSYAGAAIVRVIYRSKVSHSISAWHCPLLTPTGDTSRGCCPPDLTSSMRGESQQLAGSRVFPVHDEEVIVCLMLELTDGNLVVFGFRNQLTPENAYHLLHLLHHLNGQAVRNITLNDRISNGSTRLGTSLFSSLASAYTASGARPPLFRLHTLHIVHFPPPRRGELLLHSTTHARLHFSSVDLPYEGQTTIDWLKASMGVEQPMADSDGCTNLLDVYLRSRRSDGILFTNYDALMRGEEVELLIEVSLVDWSIDKNRLN